MLSVEIYDERELSPETLKPECDAEALALIEELGLKAQQTTEGKRISYPNPTAEQTFITNVLFPTATKIDQYDAGCIPLRVLKEIRSYRAEHPDHILLVRHQAPVVVKDPILFAYTGPHNWMWNQSMGREHRLIARWGDGLESWENLLAKAQKIMAVRVDDALQRLVTKANSIRESLKSGGSWTTDQLPQLTNVPEGW